MTLHNDPIAIDLLKRTIRTCRALCRLAYVWLADVVTAVWAIDPSRVCRLDCKENESSSQDIPFP